MEKNEPQQDNAEIIKEIYSVAMAILPRDDKESVRHRAKMHPWIATVIIGARIEAKLDAIHETLKENIEKRVADEVRKEFGAAIVGHSDCPECKPLIRPAGLCPVCRMLTGNCKCKGGQS